MLVLSRVPGEEIIAGETRFRILRVRGNNVSIGIDAPQEVRILRAEIEERFETDRPLVPADSREIVAT